MKEFLVLIFLILLTRAVPLHAQVIDNKINIYSGYQTGGFRGKELVQDGNFVAPSLFVNYKQVQGFSLQGLVNLGRFYSLGVSGGYLKASDWSLAGFDDYTNSAATMFSLAPVIQFHTPFEPLGTFNRMKVFFEIAPTAGFSKLKLAHSLVDVQNQNNMSVSTPLTSTDMYLGIKGKVGVEVILARNLGLFAAYSFEENRISSQLFNDKNFVLSQWSVGFIKRLCQNHRFYYNGL